MLTVKPFTPLFGLVSAAGKAGIQAAIIREDAYKRNTLDKRFEYKSRGEEGLEEQRTETQEVLDAALNGPFYSRLTDFGLKTVLDHIFEKNPQYYNSIEGFHFRDAQLQAHVRAEDFLKAFAILFRERRPSTANMDKDDLIRFLDTAKDLTAQSKLTFDTDVPGSVLEVFKNSTVPLHTRGDWEDSVATRQTETQIPDALYEAWYADPPGTY